LFLIETDIIKKDNAKLSSHELTPT